MSYENSVLTHTELQDNLTYQMEFGYEFEGVSDKETISTSFSTTLSKDVQDTYGMTYGLSTTIVCSSEAGDPDGGVGLWQWVSQASDGSASAFSLKTICRYGSGHWNTPPACPWNACSDVECTECYPGWNV